MIFPVIFPIDLAIEYWITSRPVAPLRLAAHLEIHPFPRRRGAGVALAVPRRAVPREEAGEQQRLERPIFVDFHGDFLDIYGDVMEFGG